MVYRDACHIHCFIHHGVNLFRAHADHCGFAHKAERLFLQGGPFAFELAGCGEVSDESAFAMAEFQDAFGGEAFVGGGGRNVLIDSDLAGELAATEGFDRRA